MKSNYFKNEFEEDQGALILDKDDKYVKNFGKQWRDHVNVQIDSKNGFNISEELLENVILEKLPYLKNKTVLEVGCGAGRFSEHIVKFAKKSVLVDLSQAIFFNVAKDNPNCTRIKADFTKLIPDQKFDVVICRGVLQHTPKPKLSILKLYDFVKDDGEVMFDIYPPPKVGFLSPKYIFWRPFFKNLIKYESCESFLTKHITLLLKLKRMVRKVLFNSRFLSDCVIPVYDYKGVIDLTDQQLEQWAVLDTLDGMYALYENPMSYNKVQNLLKQNKIKLKDSSKPYNSFRTSIN